MAEVMPVVVTRWRCPWCHKTRAKKATAGAHAEVCHHNPASRACTTCAHFKRTPCCSFNSDDCGCRGLNECKAGAFESWRYNDHGTHAPDPNGWWTHVEDWRRGCPAWAPKESKEGEAR